MKIYCKKLSENARLPEKAHKTDSGYDLFSPIDITLPAGKITKIDTDIAIEIVSDCAIYEAQVRPKSGLTSRGIIAMFGTVDSAYRGNIGVMLLNLSGDDYYIIKGDKIAQMVISMVHSSTIIPASDLSDTDRGTGGFGSTGR